MRIENLDPKHVSKVLAALFADATPLLDSSLAQMAELGNNQSTVISGNTFGLAPSEHRQSGGILVRCYAIGGNVWAGTFRDNDTTPIYSLTMRTGKVLFPVFENTYQDFLLTPEVRFLKLTAAAATGVYYIVVPASPIVGEVF